MSEIAGRLAVLAFPALLGALVAWRRWWGDLDSVTSALNRFAVDIAFPLLIVAGIAGVEGELPSSPLFWLAVPVVDLVVIVAALAVGTRRGGSAAGTAALVGIFPNSAYLGLPLVVGVFGDGITAAASAWVALQVGLAVAIGPPLLRWSRRGETDAVGGGWRRDLAGVLRRPLAIAPLVGLAARAIGGPLQSAVVDVSEPIGRAASPVALFVLGIYVVSYAARVRGVATAAAAHTTWRMLGVPLVALAIAYGAVASGRWSSDMGAVFVALFAMPAGITTFSLTLDDAEAAAGVDGANSTSVAVVASTIVVSSVAALFTIPPTIAVVSALFDAAA